MKKSAVSKIIIMLFCIICFSEVYSSPQMSPTAVRIMREIQSQYKTEKAQMYLTAYLDGKNLSHNEIAQINERMDFFFDSDTFVETGAQYLTALFNENELSEIAASIANGTFWDSAVNRGGRTDAKLAKKLQRLFEKLDPYLYRYMEQNIIRTPSVSE